MSALADLAAALLPPEAGGPPAGRVAAACRRLLEAMPTAERAAIGAGLTALEAAAVARHGRTLGSLPHRKRAALLERIASHGPTAAALDALKGLVLLAAGADSHAAEIAATGRRHRVALADPPLALLDAAELDPTKRWDAVVIGSGAGGAFAARALARAGNEVLIVEEGERWDSERIRDTQPLERFAGLYREAGTTLALGVPPIALPIGRAVGGTTVINSGTCYRPPRAVIEAWRDVHGLELADGDLAARLDDVEATLRVESVPLGVMGRNGQGRTAGSGARLPQVLAPGPRSEFRPLRSKAGSRAPPARH